MTAEVFLPIVALTLCLVYLFCRADATLDSRRPWREWVRAVESFGRLQRVWRRL